MAVLATTHSAIDGWALDRQSDARNIARHADLRTEVRALLAMSQSQEALATSLSLLRLREIVQPYLAEEHDLGFFVVSPAGIDVAAMRNETLGETNDLIDTSDDVLASIMRGNSRLLLGIRPGPSRPNTRLKPGWRPIDDVRGRSYPGRGRIGAGSARDSSRSGRPFYAYHPDGQNR